MKISRLINGRKLRSVYGLAMKVFRCYLKNWLKFQVCCIKHNTGKVTEMEIESVHSFEISKLLFRAHATVFKRRGPRKIQSMYFINPKRQHGWR